MSIIHSWHPFLEKSDVGVCLPCQTISHPGDEICYMYGSSKPQSVDATAWRVMLLHYLPASSVVWLGDFVEIILPNAAPLYITTLLSPALTHPWFWVFLVPTFGPHQALSIVPQEKFTSQTTRRAARPFSQWTLLPSYSVYSLVPLSMCHLYNSHLESNIPNFHHCVSWPWQSPFLRYTIQILYSDCFCTTLSSRLQWHCNPLHC